MMIPLAIIVAGALIAGAVVFSSGGSASVKDTTGTNGNAPADDSGSGSDQGAQLDTAESVTEADHIRGSADAPVKVVEFSDLECPFCKRFHSTMKQVKDEYGDDVSWVYRHFPLPQLHPEAESAALASECVADIAGNEAFWQFTDRMFENQNQLGDSFYEQVATDVGADASAFNQCMEEERFSDKINSQSQQARSAGGRGTPFSVVIGPDGERSAINGAQPFSQVKSTIDQALDQ